MMAEFSTLPLPAQPRYITQYAFRARVGDALIASMELAVVYDPADTFAVKFEKALARAKAARAFSAQYLDLDSEELRSGFATLPAEEQARIFDTPISDNERP